MNTTPSLYRDAEGFVWIEWPEMKLPFYPMAEDFLVQYVETHNELVRLRAAAKNVVDAWSGLSEKNTPDTVMDLADVLAGVSS